MDDSKLKKAAIDVLTLWLFANVALPKELTKGDLRWLCSMIDPAPDWVLIIAGMTEVAPLESIRRIARRDFLIEAVDSYQEIFEKDV